MQTHALRQKRASKASLQRRGPIRRSHREERSRPGRRRQGGCDSRERMGKRERNSSAPDPRHSAEPSRGRAVTCTAAALPHPLDPGLFCNSIPEAQPPELQSVLPDAMLSLYHLTPLSGSLLPPPEGQALHSILGLRTRLASPLGLLADTLQALSFCSSNRIASDCPPYPRPCLLTPTYPHLISC